MATELVSDLPFAVDFVKLLAPDGIPVGDIHIHLGFVPVVFSLEVLAPSLLERPRHYIIIRKPVNCLILEGVKIFTEKKAKEYRTLILLISYYECYWAAPIVFFAHSN